MAKKAKKTNLKPPWKRGQSGNPAGRKQIGAYVIEHAHALGHAMETGKLKYEDLRKIAKSDPNGNRRLAAVRILIAGEYPDLADFEEFNEGTPLSELRRHGINTAVVKKTKTKTRQIPQEGKEPIIEVEREIELHNRGGEDFDRIMDRSEGKPSQAVKVDGHMEYSFEPVTLVKAL